ncbi:uncharacterized protein LOC122154086 [Tyto alba]|uniref:uncharacterized protein LOC122154086 n=1 Tax=Tyto alba TaxID=56313 RepID=UPI001C67C928|nr:uncharacterized protein LOC122154086 [Tyto alba]
MAERVCTLDLLLRTKCVPAGTGSLPYQCGRRVPLVTPSSWFAALGGQARSESPDDAGLVFPLFSGAPLSGAVNPSGLLREQPPPGPPFDLLPGSAEAPHSQLTWRSPAGAALASRPRGSDSRRCRQSPSQENGLKHEQAASCGLQMSKKLITPLCSNLPVEPAALGDPCCDPQALELIAGFRLAFILWIWLKNIERLAGWPSIWETSESAVAKHCFLVRKVQAVKWQTARLASWGDLEQVEQCCSFKQLKTGIVV